MGLAETARLAVQLDLKGNFTGNLRSTQKALGDFDRSVTGAGSRSLKAGQQIGTGIRNGAYLAAGGLAFLATQVTFGLRSLATLEKAGAQTEAVLKSTGAVAGISAKQVRDLAEAYEAINATIDDKVIQSGENLLLTFTNIRKEAFEPALKTALDMNTRLGGGPGGLQNTVKLLGKALNDPLKGLGALSKAGITFNKQQTDQIKTLIENNDLLGAQNLILTELGKRYGGAFAAEGKTAEGTLAGIGDAAEDLQKTLATGLFPVIQKLLPKIRAALADPKVIAAVQKIGDSIAGLFTDANIAEGGKILGSLFNTAKAAAPVVSEAAKATLGAVRAAVSLFTSLPKEVQQLAVGAFAINKITGGLVTNIAGGLISSVLKQLVSGVVNVNGAVVNVVGAGVPGPAAGGAAKGAGGAAKGAGRLGSVLGAVGKVFLVGAAVGVFAELTSVLGDQTKANQAQAGGLTEQTAVFVKSASIEQMKASLAALKDGSKYSLAQQLALNLNIDGVRDAIVAQQTALELAIANAESASATRQVVAIERAESIASNKANELRASQNRATAATQRVEAAENRTANVVAAKLEQVRAAAQAAAFAIRDKDLSVKVNATFSVADVTRGTLRLTRYGNVAF